PARAAPCPPCPGASVVEAPHGRQKPIGNGAAKNLRGERHTRNRYWQNVILLDTNPRWSNRISNRDLSGAGCCGAPLMATQMRHASEFPNQNNGGLGRVGVECCRHVRMAAEGADFRTSGRDF